MTQATSPLPIAYQQYFKQEHAPTRTYNECLEEYKLSADPGTAPGPAPGPAACL